MKKFILILNSIMPFFAALFIQGLVYAIIGQAYVLAFGLRELPSVSDYNISIITAAVCGLIFYFWYQRLTPYRNTVKLSKLLTANNVILLMLLGVGTQFFVSGTLSILRPMFEQAFTDYGRTINSIFSGNKILVVLYIVLIAPVAEELIFRGVIQRKAALALPTLGAIVLQAALFGIYHWNSVQSIYAFANGIVLGYICYKFKSLIAPILLHIFINASAYLVTILPGTQAMFVVATVVGGICILVVMLRIKQVKI